MPPIRNRRKYKRSRRSNRNPSGSGRLNPTSAALTYNGPLSTAGVRQQDHTYTAVMHQNTSISSTAGFVISGNLDTGNPSSTSGWSALAAVWDEFRVLGARVHYEPVDRYDAPLAVTTAVNQPPLLIALDRDSSATLGTTTAIQEYESCRMVGLSDPFDLSWKMDGVEEAQFVTTATPSNSKSRGFLWIAVNNTATASTTFGYIFVTFLVQFRGLNG